jgi:hypothetical protein
MKEADALDLLLLAYDLLDAALPLALRQLSAGGVRLLDQETFWGRFVALRDGLEEADPDWQEVLNGYVDGPDGKDAKEIESNLADRAADLRGRFPRP